MPISALTNVKKYGWQVSGHFGGQIGKVDMIVLHHNAGTGTGVVPDCWRTRQGSAHYQIENGQIISCLDESRVAWHAGASGYSNNEHTLGIEHQNSTGAPNWKVSRQNEERSAYLVADIAKRYNIPIDRKHIVKHNEMPGTATQCSGGLNIDWIVNRAKEITAINNKPVEKPITEQQIFKGENMIFTAKAKTQALGKFKLEDIFIFNISANTYKKISNSEEVKYMKDVAKKTTGKDLPHYESTGAGLTRIIQGFGLKEIK